MVKQTGKTSNVKRLIVQDVVMGQDVTALTHIYDNVDEYALDAQVHEVAGGELAKLESVMKCPENQNQHRVRVTKSAEHL